MKKLKKYLISAGILATIFAGMNYQMNRMKPKPQFLTGEISKQILEEKISSSTYSGSGLKIIRYDGSSPRFAVLVNSSGRGDLEVRDISTNVNSLQELLQSGILEKVAKGQCLEEMRQIPASELLSPITAPRNIIGLAYNYFEHAQEVGETKKFKGENIVMFRKESRSVAGPLEEIVKPEEVRLLDYEAELGIVIKKKINKDTQITEHNFRDFIAGYVLVNDISARDIQLSEGTLFDKSKGFSRAKSQKGFCPCGPVFLYSSQESVFDLEQYLKRGDEFYKLQEANTSQMINSPYEILKELQRKMNSEQEKDFRIFINQEGSKSDSLEPGDILVTGTPAGVAFEFKIGYVLACRGKKGFIDFEEKNNERYLRKNDTLITISRGLGYQEHKID